MKSLRILAAIAVAAAPVLVGTAAHAAGGQAQSITITTAAPTGEDAIFDRVDGLGSYVPEGTSTSGLPVQFSVTSDNPDAPACFSIPGALGHPDEPGIITIYWNAPGICHVHADQAGDDQFAPAQQVTQDVVVNKEITHLDAAKAAKGVLGLSATTFKATLHREGRFGPGIGFFPFGSQTVTFKVAGKVMCSAVTNAQGVASCKKAIGGQNYFKAKSYTVTYGGEAYDDPTSASGALR